MDTRSAKDWQPPGHWQRFTVIDSHTGGEPFRVVIDGLPEIPGRTVLERRRYAQQHLDDLRRALMWEPRGHSDMYGGWPGPAVDDGSDLAVLFTHNDGFSTMCGHGIIALTKIVVETGMLAIADGASVRIDTPAGPVTATPNFDGDSVRSTSFRNVPSFVTAIDETVVTDELGEVRFDLAFGGAFYALVDVSEVDVPLGSAAELSRAGRLLKEAIGRTTDIAHPTDDDLGFLYGVIFVGPPREPGHHSRNVCVFANGEVDRSPTGTGVSARLAAMHARGEVSTGEPAIVESIVGSTFRGKIVSTTEVGGVAAVIPEVEGSAHLTGRAELWIDPEDPLAGGFLLS